MRAPKKDRGMVMQVTGYLDQDIADEMLDYCVDNERSMAWVMRQALAEYLVRNRKPAADEG